MCLFQLAVGQLNQVEQNLEFARDLQKSITQVYSEVSGDKYLERVSALLIKSICKLTRGRIGHGILQ